MGLIRSFDPWKNPLCSCPRKYSLNPYTGCDHKCRYCYITSYIYDAFNIREKVNLIKRVKEEIKKLDLRIPFSIANSSDPYPTIEREKKHTRHVLTILAHYNAKVLITTKSDIVVRDIDILSNMKSAVMFTITTLNEEIVAKLEPYAPSPKQRLKAMREISKKIPTGVRIDPIIFGINSDESDLEKLVKTVADTGAVHIVSSTYKPRADNWLRMVETFPDIMKKTKHLYSERVGRTRYLNSKIRREILELVKYYADKYKVTFATCREGFLDLHTAKSCDGTHLIPLIK